MTEPLTVAEAARHLGVTSDDPGYSDLSSVIKAARMTVEQYLNASIVVQERVLVRDAFPSYLPNGPVLSITSVTYVDNDGVTQTLASSAYRLTSYDMADYIEPAYNESWPSVRNVRGAVTVTYQAGMMSGSPLILSNEDIRAGIKLVLGDLWNLRETQVIGPAVSVSKTVDNLLYPHRRQLGA